MNNSIFKQESQIIVLSTVAFIIVSIWLMNLTLKIIGIGSILENNPYQSLFVLGIFVIQELLLLTPVVYYLKKKKVDLGLNPVTIRKGLYFIVVGFLAFFTINFTIQLLQAIYGFTLPGYGEQAAHLPIFGDDKFSMFVAAITLILFAPIVEETLFRGLIYTQLKKTLSKNWSIAVSAAIFAGFHLEFQVFIPLFILGSIIAYIYEETGSIWPAIWFHLINNAMAFAAEMYLVPPA